MSRTLSLARGARAPHSGKDTLLLQAIAGGEAVTLAGDGHVLARFDGTWRHAPTLDLTTLPAPLMMDAVVRFHAAPWDRTDSADLAPVPGRRTFVVSAMGWSEGVWFDGPLLHVLADGSVASYVPSGGAATLSLPYAAAARGGLSFGEALAHEGTADQRAHRCLMAAVDALAPTPDVPLVVDADELTPRAAVTLALLRQARPDTGLRLARAGGARALTPPWRRFTENAGIVVVDANGGLPLDELTRAVAASDVQRLASQVNSISAILPKSLVSP